MVDKKESKQRITIRLDNEIIEYFKQNNESYQQAINDALLSIIKYKSPKL